MTEAILESTLTCPRCGLSKLETMPTDACQSTTSAKAVPSCCGQRPVTAVSFAHTARSSARRFNWSVPAVANVRSLELRYC